MSYYLEVKHLKKSYGDIVAVKDFNLTVDKGEIIGILGANGAGKSTTLECILGTKKKDRGEVLIFGKDPIKDRKVLFESIGVQFQSTFYPEKMRVKEAITLTQSFYKKIFSMDQLLKVFSFQDKLDKYISELSIGQQQRLSVLLALIHKPKIVFLDEMSAGLDMLSREKLWKYILSLKKQGTSIILTSHYMDEIDFLCDKITIIKDGKQLIFDTKENILKQHQTTNLSDVYKHYFESEDTDESV